MRRHLAGVIVSDSATSVHKPVPALRKERVTLTRQQSRIIIPRVFLAVPS